MANKIIKVEGLAQFKEALKNYQASNPTGRLFTQFCGSVEKSTGKSWCPDCVNAEPIIQKHFNAIPDATLIYCTVGERAAWKDSNNEFRKDSDLRLTCVPTLMEWGTKKRLNDNQCNDDKIVAMFFEEED